MNDLTDYEIAQIIIEVIEKRTGIPDLSVRCRTTRVSSGKFLAARLIRELTECSYPEIADLLGWSDHSGAVHAVKRGATQSRAVKLYETVFHDLQTIHGLCT